MFKKLKQPKKEIEKPSMLVRYTPTSFSETKDIAKELKNNNVVIIDISKLSKVEAVRMIDFVSGVLFAVGGKYKRLVSKTYLIAPNEKLLNKFDNELEN